MKEIVISLDEEIEKAKEKVDTLVKGTASKEEVDKASNELGTLETIKEDSGNFKFTLKKFNMRESSQMEETMIGIRGGVKNMGSTTVTNPSITSMKTLAIKFGIKSVEPQIFDISNNDSIMNMDTTLFDYLYNHVDVFNLKNWIYRRKLEKHT